MTWTVRVSRDRGPRSVVVTWTGPAAGGRSPQSSAAVRWLRTAVGPAARFAISLLMEERAAEVAAEIVELYKEVWA